MCHCLFSPSAKPSTHVHIDRLTNDSLLTHTLSLALIPFPASRFYSRWTSLFAISPTPRSNLFATNIHLYRTSGTMLPLLQHSAFALFAAALVTRIAATPIPRQAAPAAPGSEANLVVVKVGNSWDSAVPVVYGLARLGSA